MKKAYEKPEILVTRYDLSTGVMSNCTVTSGTATCLITGTTENFSNVIQVTYDNTTYYVWHSVGGGSTSGSDADTYLKILEKILYGVTSKGTPDETIDSSDTLYKYVMYYHDSASSCGTDHWHIATSISYDTTETLINSF